ncbi:MAG: AAA family ATPase [Pseudomonadales bacterium]|jgi:putative DNA primase/helicase|nr:AAA family ATPase [Pseudomonadales bacterium]
MNNNGRPEAAAAEPAASLGAHAQDTADGAPITIGSPDGTERSLHLVNAATITPEPIQWLWPGWLARGKLHLLAGAPGTGKTTLALSLAAAITKGARFPDGTTARPGGVLIWSSEDDARDTLVPRLLACGADLSRVRFIGDVTEAGKTRPFDPAIDVRLLTYSAALADELFDLIIVDPLVAAVRGDSHKNAEVRNDLAAIVRMGQTLGAAVCGITHFSKGTSGRDPLERVTGSLAFGALARVVLVAARLEDQEGDVRLFARAKSNIGPDDGGFEYRLMQTDVPGLDGATNTAVAWGKPVEGAARQLLAFAEDDDAQTERTEAVDFLRELLASGPMNADDVKREARGAGISEKQLRTARSKLKVTTRKSGFSGGWRWALPGSEDAPEDAQGAQGALDSGKAPSAVSGAPSGTGCPRCAGEGCSYCSDLGDFEEGAA